MLCSTATRQRESALDAGLRAVTACQGGELSQPSLAFSFNNCVILPIADRLAGNRKRAFHPTMPPEIDKIRRIFIKDIQKE
ncbi:hypothetical protein D3P07_10040 [Paenibacillus sp. 1011MAR3C5]|nr:hypothetical protein D3P07_10040 [Paenibacillus sp. 1011MAR3C5]